MKVKYVLAGILALRENIYSKIANNKFLIKHFKDSSQNIDIEHSGSIRDLWENNLLANATHAVIENRHLDIILQLINSNNLITDNLDYYNEKLNIIAEELLNCYNEDLDDNMESNNNIYNNAIYNVYDLMREYSIEVEETIIT